VLSARHSYARHIQVTVGDKDSAVLFDTRVGGDLVSQYFFVVHSADRKEEGDRRAMILPGDAAALGYAVRIIAEFQEKKGRLDTTGFVIVRNEKNEVILSVPFLPACA
jgi:hypothetical protein